MNAHPGTENQYINAVALAAVQEDHTGSKRNQSSGVYQELNIGGASAAPIVYEMLKPRVKPKPRQGGIKAWHFHLSTQTLQLQSLCRPKRGIYTEKDMSQS